MKRTLAFLFCLLFAAVGVDARMTAVFCGSQTPTTTAATFCGGSCPNGTLGADQICEDTAPGDSNGLCDWTISEDGGATGDINFAATPDNTPALGCTDLAMTYGITVSKTNTTAQTLGAYGYKALITSTMIYYQAYVKINSEGIANEEIIPLIGVGGESTYATVRIALYQNSSGELRFLLEWWLSGGGNSSDIGRVNVSTDTWYPMRFEVSNPVGGGSDGVAWWIDYNNDGDFDDTYEYEGNALSLNLDVTTHAMVGYKGGAGNNPFNYTVVGIKVDDDTMPAGCTR